MFLYIKPMPAPKFPELEESILKQWEEHKIFKKTLEKPSLKGNFVFFEGPPTANGRPGIHHVIGRAFKDLIPRFRTMQGYRVERKAGWDTHGLPVELEVEKQLGLKNKKDIEDYGIDKFNAKCKESVWKYLDEWVKFTHRMGYWIDLENPYVTYKNEYVESLWWVLSEIAKKDLLYQGHKVVPYCARCGTALSSHEVAQGYAEVEEESVYVRFKLKDEPHMYALAWTTTPWTLPSNTALAVGPDITYVKARKGTDIYVVAKDRLEVLGEVEIMAEVKGEKLVGKEYEPLYDFIPHEKKAHRIVAGDFVSTEDGSGIVHLAPFGEDDMQVIQKEDFPVLMTVGLDGKFVDDVKPWAGTFVKDADEDIMEDLEKRELLFKREKYKHDYPFCWRCKTPLLYYPKHSWFIRMSSLQEELEKNNATINWEPEHIRDGRFGEWLSGVKDWALSRERYWGTPLPIWKCGQGHTRVIGSLEEMHTSRFRENRFFLVRHGQANHNDEGVAASWPESDTPPRLTDIGKEKVRETAEQLKKEGVEIIISSDLVRTKETSEILKQVTGAEVVFDERLREISVGKYNGKSLKDYHAFFSSDEERITKAPEGAESLEDLRARVMGALLDIDQKYKDKKIALVSHGDVIWILQTAVTGEWGYEALFGKKKTNYPETGSVTELVLPNWPFDHRGALDVHRPHIDRVTVGCEECGEEMHRVPEVLDVWFDSGAMPFAQWHYPFENKERIDEGLSFPADYISEAIDQTRGWFYTLLAVSTLLGKGAPYKNVICYSHILDAKGQKMSKSKGNVVDPLEMFDKFGADALRFLFYTVNKPGDTKKFDEKDVDQIVKKVFLMLWNVLSFWKMYADGKGVRDELPKTENALDKWILSNLAALVDIVTDRLENYDVVSAGREIMTFVNSLSTWYLRRSRDRFKNGTDEEKRAAVETLGYCILTLSKVMAPFTPFVAEGLYKELDGVEQSVHLESWPETSEGGLHHDKVMHNAMNDVIGISSEALRQRAEAKINVRQVLPKLTVRSQEQLADWARDILKAEVNVKAIGWEKADELEITLDTELTDELRREGAARELTRHINSLRKNAGLTRQDRIIVRYETGSDFWKQVIAEHVEAVRLDVLSEGFEDSKKKVGAEKDVDLNGEAIWLGVEKI